jgi:HD-GYP domain-containing protein (c-di-GMP phosphodiesterase class II)
MYTLLNLLLVVALVWVSYKYLDLRERYWENGIPDLAYLEGMSRFIDSSEGYQGEHGREVALLAEKLALSLNLPTETVTAVKIAGFLHDAGELAIPRDFFKAERKLEPEEWFLIRTHPVIGEMTLRRTLPPYSEVPSLIRWHHEKWDGTGYPDRLCGAEIPLGARILAVADACSAMRAGRPYRPALDADQVRVELQKLAGLQFDPLVVQTYLKLEGEGAKLA